MNKQSLQYQLGLTSYNEYHQYVRKHEFDRLLESVTRPRFYNFEPVRRHQNAKGKGLSFTVTALAIDKTGGFLLGGNDNGSVSLWAMDDKLDDGELSNKRIGFISRSTEPSEPKKATNRNVSEDDSLLVHSFETKRNKFRMYRKSTKNNSGLKPRREEEEEEEEQEQEGNIEKEHAHSYGITTLQWYSNDNGMFFTGGNDSNIKVWDTNTFQSVVDVDIGHKITQMDTQNNVIALACEDYYPRLLDVNNINSKGITTVGNKTMSSETLCCKFHPTREHVLCSSDSNGHVRIWDLRMRNRLLLEVKESGSHAMAQAHLKACNAVYWSESGSNNELVTLGTDGKCKKWDLGQDEVVACRMLGDTDQMRNRYKKRTSQRLLWYDDFVIVNTDQSELVIFETATSKLYAKIEQPLLLPAADTATSTKQQFTSMALQRDLTNSKGLRLILGTNTGMGNIVEYMNNN